MRRDWSPQIAQIVENARIAAPRTKAKASELEYQVILWEMDQMSFFAAQLWELLSSPAAANYQSG
jgi:predicted 2-oxoglutarate/Fe(II)-dependent dioxygenase YbiX